MAPRFQQEDPTATNEEINWSKATGLREEVSVCACPSPPTFERAV